MQYFELFFQLYNAHSSSQKSQKQHFVMLLPSLGSKQHKINKNSFEKCLMFFFQKFYKNKWPYFCSIFFSFNFLSINKIISCLFDVYCKLIFDPWGKFYWPQMRVDVQRHYFKYDADNIEELDLRIYPFSRRRIWWRTIRKDTYWAFK